MAQQEEALRKVGVGPADAYRDVLNVTQLRRREPASLTQRAKMLRSTPQNTEETIYVAGLRCFGWNMADIARALAAAGHRGSSVHAIDINVTFTVAMLNSVLLDALADADEAWRRGQTKDGRTVAAVAIAAKAEEARRAKLEAARPLWAKPPGEISGAEIANRVGLSLRSLNNWLGPRSRTRRKSPD